jgi:hypothetical protein
VVEIDSSSKLIFELVDVNEKFGIEFKASLNKSSNASTTSKCQAVQISKNPRV